MSIRVNLGKDLYAVAVGIDDTLKIDVYKQVLRSSTCIFTHTFLDARRNQEGIAAYVSGVIKGRLLSDL